MNLLSISKLENMGISSFFKSTIGAGTLLLKYKLSVQNTESGNPSHSLTSTESRHCGFLPAFKEMFTNAYCPNSEAKPICLS